MTIISYLTATINALHMKKNVSLYTMASIYIASGIYHFIDPSFYEKIMPKYLPWHLFFIYLTGILGIVFGLLVLPKRTRKAGAWCLIVFLLAVFPANFQMMVNFMFDNNPYLWLAVLRLPLQLILIWWAWLYTEAKEEEKHTELHVTGYR